MGESRFDELPLMGEVSRRLESAIEQFEIAWRAGTSTDARPRIEEVCLSVPNDERPRLCLDLVLVEIELRRRAGEEPTVEEYCARFPVLNADRFREAMASADRVAALRLVQFQDTAPAPDSTIDSPPVDPDATLSFHIGAAKQPFSSQRPSQRSTANDTIKVGIVLNDRYRLESKLGQGGMGQVFLARDLTLDRSVAIKIILSDRVADAIGDLAMQARFFEEAKLGAQLRHASIATVLDYGVACGQPFTVFEFVPGSTLRDILRQRGRFPLDEVQHVVAQLAQALDYAHSVGVVHRDLKPENIVITKEGDATILDLGVARRFLTENDWSFAGTPAYAAPEQIQERPSDGRTDQYALGLIVYEMLTGTRQFVHRDVRRVLTAHLEEPPRSPQQVTPDLPDPPCNAVLRALAKSQDDRFPSCLSFASSLGCHFIGIPRQYEPPKLESPAYVNICFDGRLLMRRFIFRRGQVALTNDALWVSRDDEIFCLPLNCLTRGKQNMGSTILCRHFRFGSRQVDVFLRFPDRTALPKWRSALLEQNNPEQQRVPEAMQCSDALDPKYVVLLRRPPTARFQFLNLVGGTGKSRRDVEAMVKLRTAILGGEAVADFQEEKLPGFRRTERRMSGIAIRPVEEPARQELAVRAHAECLRKIGRDMFWIVVCVILTVRLDVISLLEAAIPICAALALFFFQRPQLGRAAAVIFFGFALSGVIRELSRISAGALGVVVPGNWARSYGIP